MVRAAGLDVPTHIPMNRKQSTSGLRPGVRRRRLLLVGIPLAAFLALVAVLFLGPFWRLTSQFDELTYRQPSRLYARATLLFPGRPIGADRVTADLDREGYREDAGSGPLPTGRYRKSGRDLAVHLRSFPLPQGEGGGGLVEITFRGQRGDRGDRIGRIGRLTLDGRAVESVPLEPPLIASYYGSDLKERRPVAIEEVPEDLVGAVMAAEDASFFRHSGVSVRGMVRATWVNARGRGLRQGGSTLTQQLVKNLYLTQERTFTRKAQEIVFSLLLEARYKKRQILEAYLNEIYLGAAGGVNLMGMGAASRAYFGKDVAQLDLAESAALAGMISSPATFSPLTHPERCRARRDWVLRRMAQLRLAQPARVDQALAQPVGLAPEPVVRRRAPYFADAMAQEAERRFGVSALADGGYALFSTLDWRDQRTAQDAVERGLRDLEKGWEKRHRGAPLQAALVSLDPETGGILAYVGGRQYTRSQFDRAGQAHRQAGSAFKPIVYAAAFETRRATPASFLEDSPLTVRLANKTWSPKNDDGSFHGWVSVRAALEHSYNPATARLALQVGMEKVVDLAHDMGVAAPMDPFPSVALGAVEVTPAELAGVYATLATGGIRPPVHGLVAIRDRYGKRLTGTALPEREWVLTPQSAYLVTTLLQGVLDRGTGRGARAQGVTGELAGKTGTTNRRRDAWFAGYSPERASAVWVGYDDNSPTNLSGARGALPIWSRFTAAVRPPGGYSAFEQPPGVTTALIDPTTGMLATEYCPEALTEVFPEGKVPTQVCDRHTSWTEEAIAATDQWGDAEEGGGAAPAAAEAREERGPEKPHPFRRWLRRVFGSEGDHGDRGDRGDHGDRGEHGREDPREPPPARLKEVPTPGS